MAKVRRGGVTRRVPAAEVVPGDVIEVAAGDRVPADARVLEVSALGVDEAMLTGESQSAGKQVGGAGGPGVPLGDRDGELFSGTLVVRGAATALVERTGAATEMGRIAGALEGRQPKSPLEADLAQASRRIGLLALAALATALLQALVTLVPPLGAPLALVPLPATGWALALGIAVLTPLLCDLIRWPATSGAGVRPGGDHQRSGSRTG
ncbi:cation transporting ATPase C-terminal domain-containing protein [Streptosporangium sp. NPDC023963]|uniref:P-type ATPase n=1 Tax=Streptosporangium sp. NPDC023963 TaxID=3155608 RepID=UPI00341C65B9